MKVIRVKAGDLAESEVKVKVVGVSGDGMTAYDVRVEHKGLEYRLVRNLGHPLARTNKDVAAAAARVRECAGAGAVLVTPGVIVRDGRGRFDVRFVGLWVPVEEE